MNEKFAKLFWNHNNQNYDEAQWEDASEEECQEALFEDAKIFLTEYAEIAGFCGNPTPQQLVQAYNYLDEVNS